MMIANPQEEWEEENVLQGESKKQKQQRRKRKEKKESPVDDVSQDKDEEISESIQKETMNSAQHFARSPSNPTPTLLDRRNCASKKTAITHREP